MRQLHRLQFRLGTLLLVMAAIGVGIVVFRYPSQRRTAVKRTYEEQRKVLDQSLEDFRDLLERDKLFLVARNSRHSDDNGEWRQPVELIGHKLRYKIGEPGEEVIGQFIVQGLVSRGADGNPDWWTNLPVKITTCGGSLDEQFVTFFTERLQAKKWAFEVQHGGQFRE